MTTKVEKIAAVKSEIAKLEAMPMVQTYKKATALMDKLSKPAPKKQSKDTAAAVPPVQAPKHKVKVGADGYVKGFGMISTKSKANRAKRVRIRKWEGDDIYSWAMFVDGQVTYSGMSKSEAEWRRRRFINEGVLTK